MPIDTQLRPRRVLVEDEDPAWHRLMTRLADPGEFEFDYCRGPFLAPGGCPLLEGRPCPKLEAADTVLHSLDPGRSANRAVFEAVKARCPGPVTLLEGKPATWCLTHRP